MAWSSKNDSGKATESLWLDTESEYTEDWLDAELENEEIILGESPTGTEYMGHSLKYRFEIHEAKSSVQLILISVIVLLCSVFLAVQLTREKSPSTLVPVVATSTPEVEATGPAESQESESRWVGGDGQTSFQIRDAIYSMEESGASTIELQKARLELGKALHREDKPEQAHKVLSAIRSPELTAVELEAVESSLRSKGDELLFSARSSLSIDPDDARKDAERALRLFETYHGEPHRLASAHEIVGRSFLAQGQQAAAAHAYQRALEAEYSAERQRALDDMQGARPNQVRVRNETESGTRTGHRPRLRLDNSGVPKAKRRVGRQVKGGVEQEDPVQLDLDEIPSRDGYR